VIEERRLRIEDNPNAKVAESLNLISFDKKGAYYAPIIGFQADIESNTVSLFVPFAGIKLRVNKVLYLSYS
jgi:zinc protease